MRDRQILEELLEQSLDEARRLFDDQKIFTAGYTLFLARKRYNNAGATIPPEIERLEQEIQEKAQKTYPEKIREYIIQGDLECARSTFLYLSLLYSRRVARINPLPPHLPYELYPLLELLKEKAESAEQGTRKEVADFVASYPRRLFEEIS